MNVISELELDGAKDDLQFDWGKGAVCVQAKVDERGGVGNEICDAFEGTSARFCGGRGAGISRKEPTVRRGESKRDTC